MMSKMKANSAGSSAQNSEETVALDPNGQISRKLRELYDTVQDESIPDRFLDLLEKLDEAEQAARSPEAKQHDRP